MVDHIQLFFVLVPDETIVLLESTLKVSAHSFLALHSFRSMQRMFVVLSQAEKTLKITQIVVIEPTEH